MSSGIILLMEINEFDKNRLAAPLLDFIANLAKEKRGTLVSTMAGKIVCKFDDPQAASETALQIQKNPMSQCALGKPQVRISLHDISSTKDAAELAKALKVSVKTLSFADFGKTVVSASTADLLAGAHTFNLIPETEERSIKVFELEKPPLIPKAEAHTCVIHTSGVREVSNRWVQLVVGGRQGKKFLVSEKNSIVTFGRNETNDIVMESEMVSRYHGYVEYRERKVYITDKSSNGIFMFPIYGNQYKISKESKLIPAQGYFSLGKSVEESSNLSIQFRTVIDGNS